MTTFIKSSAKCKPEPLYYKKILDRLSDRIAKLIEDAGLNENVQPPNGPELWEVERQIVKLRGKFEWAARMLVCAQGIKARQAEGIQ